LDLKTVWDKLPVEEQERVSKLEIFDEFEEWRLLMAHYCLLVASTNPEDFENIF
jgi:hypothetical protein